MADTVTMTRGKDVAYVPAELVSALERDGWSRAQAPAPAPAQADKKKEETR